MATVDGRSTLLDYAMLEDPDGKQAQVMEVLNSQMPMLQDAPAYPANEPLGNRTIIRTGLPTVNLGRLNKGTPTSRGSWAARQDTIGMLDGKSEVDARMRKIVGQAAFDHERRVQNAGYLESFAQKATDLLLYGSSLVNEEAFDGFLTRLGTLNDDVDNTVSQVIGNAGTSGGGGDLCSILVIDWGETGAHLIFPPNTVAGLDVEDEGIRPVKDDGGTNEFNAAVTSYLWFVGLAIKDYRHVGALRNIDLSAALANTGTGGPNLIDNVMKLLDQMPEPNGLQRVIYIPKRLYTAFRVQALAKSNVWLSVGEYLKRPTLMLDGYPVRREWRMSVAESQIS